MNPIKITTPLKEEIVLSLKAGDEVLISGIVYTARDAAHLRLVKLIEEGRSLPIDLSNQVIYYTAPTPPKPGKPFGSCGPTSSYRMDEFTPPLLVKGLRGMIGKGQRSFQIRELLKKYQAIYFLALAGGGAYLSSKVKKAKLIAFADLQTEAIYKLWVQDFPVIVGIDTEGKDIYQRLSK